VEEEGKEKKRGKKEKKKGEKGGDERRGPSLVHSIKTLLVYATPSKLSLPMLQ